MATRDGRRAGRQKLPHELVWVLGTLGLVLPLIGGVMAATGLWQLLSGSGGWGLLIIGLALLALDLMIDLWLADPETIASDEDGLNKRGTELIGRTGRLEEAITAGRGRIQMGDTVWTVEGPELPAGSRIRVTGVNGAVLTVEAAPAN